MGVLSLIHVTLTSFIICKEVAFILAMVDWLGLFVLVGYTQDACVCCPVP